MSGAPDEHALKGDPPEAQSPGTVGHGSRTRSVTRSIRSAGPPVARVLGVSLVLLGIYAWWPLEAESPTELVIRLCGAVVLLVAVFVLQLRSILRSARPGLRALESLTASILLLLVAFASVYYAMSVEEPSAFSEHLDKLGAMYFAITTLATVGYGDIAAQSDPARLAVSIQMLFDLVFLGVGIRVMSGVIQTVRGRGGPAEGTSQPT